MGAIPPTFDVPMLVIHCVYFEFLGVIVGKGD